MEPARLPTTESNGLDILWTRLREANSDIKVAGHRIRKAKKVWVEALDLVAREKCPRKALKPLLNVSGQLLANLTEDKIKLEERRDTIRLAINEQLRPLLRPLTVLDLPDELLRHIFEYAEGDLGMFDLFFLEFRTGDIELVKNLRLTCKRFCDTSSHLLKYYVKVEMTPQSIAYLNEVSQHPTISKGIRAVQIYLGRHFDADIAGDIQAFARYQTSRIRTYISDWKPSLARPYKFDKTPTEVYERAIDKATCLAAHWEDAIQSGIDMSRPEHVLLRTSQEQYQRCYESQLLLQHGGFGEAVAYAMKRMPTATWLVIEDENHSTYYGPDYKLTTIFPEDLEDPILLQQKLQAPAFSWRMANDHGLRSPPIDTIPKLLQSLQEAALCLKGIDICVPLPDDLSCLSTTEIDHSKLRAISQKLRAFYFNPKDALQLSLDTSNLLGGFLSTILDSCSLQRIDIYMDIQYKTQSHDPPTFSTAPILLSRTWPELKELSYNGPFYFEELQKVVHRIGKGVDLQWGGYLMDASWAEVLDFLKGRVSHDSRVGDGNGSIAGAECHAMDGDEFSLIFSPGMRPFSMSRATKFIQGWIETNPVIDWENGDLENIGENGYDESVTTEDDEFVTTGDD